MPSQTNYAGEIANWLEDYRAKGAREASASRPASDSVRMDQHEAAVQSEGEKWLASEQRLFDVVLTETSRSAVDIQQKSIAVKSRVDQLLSDRSLQATVESEMAGERPALVTATEKRMLAEVDWRYFRAANGISDQAVYPESHIWHFAIVGLLALIETGINAFFYENAQGVLGGFTVALGVAAINMGGALILGIGFRYKNLAAIDKKMLGWLCLIAFIALSVYCNALFSAFRAEYQILVDPSDPTQLRHAFAQASGEAKKVFVWDMRFADLMSLILFGLGFLLSCAAFYKGYTIDDRYPDHGRKDRAVKAAQRVELERQDVLRQKIRTYLHQRRADIQAVMHEPAQLVGRIAKCAGDLQHGQALLVNQANAVQRDFALVLNTYRNANAGVRATQPPAYFRDIPNLAGRVSTTGGNEVTAALGRINDDLKLLREKYQEPLNTKLNEIQGGGAEVLNRTFSEFIKEVSLEAEGRINSMTPTIHRASA